MQLYTGNCKVDPFNIACIPDQMQVSRITLYIPRITLLEMNKPIDIAMLPEEEMLNLVDAKCSRG